MSARSAWTVGSGAAVAALVLWLAMGSGQAQTNGGPDAGVDGAIVADSILDFHAMAPVTPPFTGASNAVRGVNGAGLPWAVAHADGTLRSDGGLVIHLSGLVLASEAPVPAAQRGTNPLASFTAVVSCLSKDQTGAAKQVNLVTAPATANPAGDATIDATVALPTPCIAPVVFVADSSGTSWIAVSGR